MEYDANLFASETALPDDEIPESIYRGCNASEIARAMYSDINLIAIKAADLNRRGHTFHPPDHRNDFLK